MSKLGHNNGPTMEPGNSWRKHCWTKARRDLLPNLPIEILRTRVKRAQELGLEYKTYASVRASTGRDVIGFLFSSNALRSFLNSPSMPVSQQDKLTHLKNCMPVAMVNAPLTPKAMMQANPAIPEAFIAPGILSGWGETARLIDAARLHHKLPADAVLLVGDTTLEREWGAAGRLAGYVPAERYFNTAP